MSSALWPSQVLGGPFSNLVNYLTCVRCDAMSDYNEWATFTGQAPNLVHAFANASSWANVVTLVQAQIDLFPGVPLAWAFPLATGTQGNPPTQTTTPAQVAAGTYDSQINDCLDRMLLHNPGVGPIYIRPGWEAGNVTAWPWGATTNIANAKADFIAAFRKVSTLIRAKSSRFVISFCVANANFDNTGAVVNPVDPTTGFDPGVAYYDAIGIDGYLVGVDVSNAQTFEHLSQNTGSPNLLVDDVAYGFKYLADFARTNNRSMTIDEWGIGAERPDYIRAMANFVADTTNRVLYHGYWNKNAPAGSPPYQFPCRLSDNSNNYPLSKAEYLSAFTRQGSPSTNQAETSALIARTTATVTSGRRSAYDTLIAGMKAAGLLPYYDVLYLTAGQDNNITLINLFGAGGFTTTVPRTTGRLAINGSPVFVADRGFTGDGTTAAFLRATGYNMTSALNRKVSLNDMHLSAWFLTANSNAGAQSYEVGVANTFIARNGANTRWVIRPNNSTTVNGSAAGHGAGDFLMNRTASNAWATAFNGVADLSGTDASTSLTNDDLRVCGIPGLGGGANQIAMVSCGRAIPLALQPARYSLLLAYMQAVGAA